MPKVVEKSIKFALVRPMVAESLAMDSQKRTIPQPHFRRAASNTAANTIAAAVQNDIPETDERRDHASFRVVAEVDEISRFRQRNSW